jgi:hypothetical protein
MHIALFVLSSTLEAMASYCCAYMVSTKLNKGALGQQQVLLPSAIVSLIFQ